MELLSETIASIALGLVPPSVLDALRVGESVPLDKGGGEVRPLLVGSTYRRLGLRALMMVKRERVSDAVGQHQYGVGRKGGAELLISKLRAQTEARPQAVVIKVDQKAAPRECTGTLP